VVARRRASTGAGHAVERRKQGRTARDEGAAEHDDEARGEGAPSTLLELRPQAAMADSDGDGAAHEGARGAGSASSFRRASLGTGVGGAIILDVELAPTRGSQRRGIRWVPATSTSTSGELLLILPSPTL
jgi:hypothetical protein